MVGVDGDVGDGDGTDTLVIKITLFNNVASWFRF